MMRGGGPGRKKWCDRRRLMIGVCCVNFLALLFVILSLHTSIYFSPSSPSIAGASSSFISIPETNFSREQIEKMKEFIELRRAAEPTELAKLANSLWKKLSGKRKEAGLSPRMKQKVADEILQMLKALEPRAYMTEQQEALERWRMAKLETLTRAIHGSSTSAREARALQKALAFNWLLLLEEIGLSMPVKISNKENKEMSSEMG